MSNKIYSFEAIITQGGHVKRRQTLEFDSDQMNKMIEDHIANKFLVDQGLDKEEDVQATAKRVGCREA